MPKKNNEQLPTLLTTNEVACYLKLAPQTIRNWIAKGKLPSIKLGRSRYLDAAELSQWIKQQK